MDKGDIALNKKELEKMRGSPRLRFRDDPTTDPEVAATLALRKSTPVVFLKKTDD